MSVMEQTSGTETPSPYLLIDGQWYFCQINDDDECPVSMISTNF